MLKQITPDAIDDAILGAVQDLGFVDSTYELVVHKDYFQRAFRNGTAARLEVIEQAVVIANENGYKIPIQYFSMFSKELSALLS
jgi:hypothetical protein